MLRKVLLAFGILLFGVSAAVADSCQDAIDARLALMEQISGTGKVANAMIKGMTPFDLATARQIFAILAASAKTMGTLFPDCSKTGRDTRAAPAIWNRPDDFKAAIAQFAADIRAAQDTTKDLDTFRDGFYSMGKNCGVCHRAFRINPLLEKGG